jgi:DNA/RNA endonuclease G (NUC1)
VSWQLNKSWIGNAIRPGASDAPLGYPPTGFPDGTPFSPDKFDYPWLGDHQIPAGWERTEGPDYRYNQRRMERGHMASVADRTRANKDVFATYLTSNLIPQHRDNNRGAWENFENAIRKPFENEDPMASIEYYIMAGGYGYDPNNPERKIRNLIDGQLVENPKGILIPEYTWKIVVPLLSGQGISDIDTNTEPVAIMVPNRYNLQATPQNPKYYTLPGEEEAREITNWNDWRSWQVPIDYLEKRTGYDFLSELPENVQEILESKIDGILPT